MKEKYVPRTLPRGRIVQWSREKLAALSTIELRQLYANALRLNEAELATTCDELLKARPHGHPQPARKRKSKGNVVNTFE
jgi:hypothetical protein